LGIEYQEFTNIDAHTPKPAKLILDIVADKKGRLMDGFNQCLLLKLTAEVMAASTLPRPASKM